MSKPNTARVVIDGDDADFRYLKCPSCGSDNLYHGEVAARRHTSAAFGYDTQTLVAGGNTTTLTVPSSVSRNPSGWGVGSGIAIGFRCEHCPVRLELTIAAHKGYSLVRRRVGEKTVMP
jgi:hypothetical protein